MKERILGISNLIVSLAIVLSYLFARELFPKVAVAGEILIVVLCIFLYETDVDYGCLVLMLGYTILFPAYLMVHSFLSFRNDYRTTERISGLLGLLVSGCTLLFLFYRFFIKQ